MAGRARSVYRCVVKAHGGPVSGHVTISTHICGWDMVVWFAGGDGPVMAICAGTRH
jgi:hypothetical protein